MTIIDMHAHIAHRSLFHQHFLTGMKEVLQQRAALEYGVKLPSDLMERLVQRRLADPDCGQLLAQMNAAGISRTVLLLADFGYGHEDELTLEQLYEHYYTILRAHPDRFVVFGGSDPRRGPAAVALFEHGLRDLGFAGLKLYPPCGYELDDRSLFPYYELCAAYRVPVLAHTGPSLSTLPGGHRYPASIHEVASQFSRVNFVLGHAAFTSFEANLSIAMQHRNVYLETSGFQRLLDRTSEVQRQLRVLFDQVPDQVVFGTDWPVFNLKGTQLDWVNYFMELGVLDESRRARFFYRNAEAALGSGGR